MATIHGMAAWDHMDAAGDRKKASVTWDMGIHNLQREFLAAKTIGMGISKCNILSASRPHLVQSIIKKN